MDGVEVRRPVRHDVMDCITIQKERFAGIESSLADLLDPGASAAIDGRVFLASTRAGNRPHPMIVWSGTKASREHRESDRRGGAQVQHVKPRIELTPDGFE